MKKHFQAMVWLLAGAGALHAGPVTLNSNLIINGDAESGVGSTDGSTVIVPGWSAVGLNPMFTAVQYQSVPGGFPEFSDPGPASRGLNFFAGGNGNATSMGIQDFDVSSLASQIDAGQITFAMSAYLGGFATQDDFAAFSALFLNGSNAQVGSSPTLTGPNAVQRSSQTGLLLESLNGTLPVGTRTIQFSLSMTRLQGTYNDGYADNLSFDLNSVGAGPSVPEPGTVSLFGIAAAALAIRRWRQACG